MNVETTGDGTAGPFQLTLQWSHVLMNVETASAPAESTVMTAASMEPRPHERGNARRWP